MQIPFKAGSISTKCFTCASKYFIGYSYAICFSSGITILISALLFLIEPNQSECRLDTQLEVHQHDEPGSRSVRLWRVIIRPPQTPLATGHRIQIQPPATEQIKDALERIPSHPSLASSDRKIVNPLASIPWPPACASA